MLMGRLLDIGEVNGSRVDRVIGLKFPAYYAAHPVKVCWILHQHRQAYDLYGTRFTDLWDTEEGRAVAAEIKRWDDYFLPQSKALFANSKTVAARLLRFNNLTAVPLYHPPANAERFTTGPFDSYIFYPGRFDAIKRQHLIFEALALLPEKIQLVLCGQHDSDYGSNLLQAIKASPHGQRVRVLGRISEAQKIELYSNCLAVYNGVFDEDYGYVTLEAFCSGKPVLTHSDSGGPLEFVVHGHNGYVTEPNAHDLAAHIRRLIEKPALAKQMGSNARKTMQLHNISWDYVIENLLA
jgi:glycosyltransferase involved in cell wall biosynthesis